MDKLKVSAQKLVEQEAVKNLLTAQKRLAAEEGGSGIELILVTKFLLRLAKQCGDVLVDVIPEGNE